MARCGRRRSPVEEDVEGVGSPVKNRQKVQAFGCLLIFFLLTFSCISRVIFLPRSCLLGSFVIFFHVLSMFYFKQSGKDY